MSFNDDGIVSVKDEAINLLRNADLTKRSGNLYNIGFLYCV